MTKQEFLHELKKSLKKLPKSELDECISFYGEMIDDRIEAGLSEEEAVAALGSIKKIASEKLTEQMSEALYGKDEKKEAKPEKKNKNNSLGTTLLMLGSPVWFSLLISFAAIVFSLFVSAWAVIVSLWATFAALAICGVAGIVLSLAFIFIGTETWFLLLSTALLSVSLAIFSFFGLKALTKYFRLFSIKLLCLLKEIFIKKETKK